jgi:predicted XRE-type DNA-binding protein
MPRRITKQSIRPNVNEGVPLIEKGSANVFADLGLPNPEESLAKSDIARQLNRTIAQLGLNQSAAGKIMGIPQPRVSELSRHRLSLFSLDKLLELANRLGIDIEIHMRQSTEPHLKVLTA